MTQPEAQPAIHREIVVDADPARAFEVFTQEIGAWWPLADLSVFGAGGSVAFTNDEIVETSPDGESAVWGSVHTWDPPERLAFSWHPGQDGARASSVSVSFVAAGEQTLVVLEHDGWEVFTEPAAARAEYDHGWPAVLDAYAQEVSATWTWAVLMHTPGPAAAEGSIFSQPLFAEHVAFLQRMATRGHLVAAGPLMDAAGAGMTVLRARGEDRLDELARLATEDDQSVALGLFSVIVRPWQVSLSALD